MESTLGRLTRIRLKHLEGPVVTTGRHLQSSSGYTLKKKVNSPNPPKRFGGCQKLPNELKCRKSQ